MMLENVKSSTRKLRSQSQIHASRMRALLDAFAESAFQESSKLNPESDIEWDTDDQCSEKDGSARAMGTEEAAETEDDETDD